MTRRILVAVLTAVACAASLPAAAQQAQRVWPSPASSVSRRQLSDWRFPPLPREQPPWWAGWVGTPPAGVPWWAGWVGTPPAGVPWWAGWVGTPPSSVSWPGRARPWWSGGVYVDPGSAARYLATPTPIPQGKNRVDVPGGEVFKRIAN